MSASKQRLSIAILAILATIATVLIPTTASAQPLGVERRSAATFTDISNLSQGRAAASAATVRWAARGVYQTSDSLQVLRSGSGDSITTVVLPPGVRLIETVRTPHASGGLESSMVVEVSADGFVGAGAGSSWNLKSSACYAREENATGWIDSCYKVNQYKTDTTDGTSTRDIFQLHHYATAKSKGIYTLTSATLSSKRSTSGPAFREWHDWNPRADLDKGNCVSTTVGVTYGGVGISSSHNVCDKWDITKNAAVGDFANVWKGSAWRSEREVAYMTVIKVDQAAFPIWSLSDSFFAW